MKKIFVVGESIPLNDDGTNYRVTPCGELDSGLVPFDPRHGVFCNFVTTPLLTAANSLIQSRVDINPLMCQLSLLLSDKSDRRFNVFEMKKKGNKEPFVIRNDLLKAVNEFDPSKQLWLMTGYQTNFGLIAWLLDNKQNYVWQRTRLKEFAFEFLLEASKHENLLSGWPVPVKKTPKTSHTAILHRLCIEVEGRDMLEKAVKKFAKEGVDADAVVELLRSTVPLLHNEAYRDKDIGNVQKTFVEYATGKINEKPCDQYWQVMGAAIAIRLQNEFLKR